MQGTSGTLSVAMTTYNGRRYVKEQLDSLMAQDHPPDEVVIGDDCSTDGTFEYLREYARTADVPVRVEQNSANLGWRANFMAVAGRCTGDLIAFCDQDDIWHPEKLTRMRQVMAPPEVMMAYHNAALVDERGTRIGALFGEPSGVVTTHAPVTADLWTSILGFSMVWKRELLEFTGYWADSVDKLKPLEERAAHDQWFQFLSSALGETVYVDEALVSYRIHESNSMGYRHTRWKLGDLIAIWRHSHRKVRDRLAVVENRIALMERMVDAQPQRHAELSRALAAYQDHLHVTRERLGLYGAPRAARLRTLLLLVRGGAYQSPVLPLARKEQVRDVLVALVGHD